MSFLCAGHSASAESNVLSGWVVGEKRDLALRAAGPECIMGKGFCKCLALPWVSSGTSHMWSSQQMLGRVDATHKLQGRRGLECGSNLAPSTQRSYHLSQRSGWEQLSIQYLLHSFR